MPRGGRGGHGAKSRPDARRLPKRLNVADPAELFRHRLREPPPAANPARVPPTRPRRPRLRPRGGAAPARAGDPARKRLRAAEASKALLLAADARADVPAREHLRAAVREAPLAVLASADLPHLRAARAVRLPGDGGGVLLDR
jgi:hypothetical protein